MKRQLLLLVGLTAVVAFVLGLVAAGSRPAGEVRSAMARPASTPREPLTISVEPALTEPSGASNPLDFSVVAAKLNAAVVNIDAASRGADRPANPRRFQRNYR